MNICSSFKANAQSAILMKPCKCSFYYPAMFTKSTAMWRTPKSKKRLYATISQSHNIFLRAVCAIALHSQRMLSGTTMRSLNRWNLIYHRQKLRRVVSLCSSERKHQGHAVGVGNNMMFASGFSSIHGGRTTFFPPRQPTGLMQNRQSLVTNRFYRHCPVYLKALCASLAKHDAFANRVNVASNSCHYHSPFLAAACSKEFPI